MFEWNGKGYLVGGEQYNGSYTNYKDIWEYTPSSDTWVQKTDMPGAARCHAFCQSSGASVYYRLGEAANTNFYSDIFRYDCATGLATVDGDAWWSAAYGKKVMVMNIQADPTIDSALKHIYVYDTTANTWTVYPFANKAGYRFTSVVGQTGAKAYVGIGYDPTPDHWFTDMWEVNLAAPSTSVESQHPEFADIHICASAGRLHAIIPAEVFRTIEWLTLQLVGMDGRLGASYKLRRQEIIDISGLPQGITATSSNQSISRYNQAKSTNKFLTTKPTVVPHSNPELSTRNA